MQKIPSDRKLLKDSKILKSLDKLDLISKIRSDKKSASPYRLKNSLSLMPAPYITTEETLAQVITEVEDERAS